MGERRILGPFLLALALATFMRAIVPAGASTISLSAGPCKSWKPVPFAQLRDGTLYDVAGTSSNDVWTVGSYDYAPSAPIIGHFDGTTWTLSPQGGTVGALFSVDAIAPDDAWAVGWFYGTVRPLAEHWDGTRWTVVPAPSGGSADSLYSVSAVSANDVWAVGVTTVIGSGLTEHWDGTTWSVVTDDAPPYGDILYDVSAVSTNDVWAVGYQATVNFGEFQPFVEHWDGSKWTQTVVPPAPKGSDDTLTGVVGISSTDAWTVGSYAGPPEGPKPLVYHWDGTAWTLMNVPTHTPGWTDLVEVSATSSNDVWIVGGIANEISTDQHQLVDHWDGTTWKIVRTPDGPANPVATAIGAISPTDIWVVGLNTDTQTLKHFPLTERSFGHC